MAMGDFHPGGILPLEPGDVPDHRCGFRRRLAVEGVGVGLELLVPGEAGTDVVLVRRALAETGDEDFPDTAIAAAHGMAAGVPIVELAGDGDTYGVGRPHGEANAGDAIGVCDVRAERAPRFMQRALGVQIEVGIGDPRAEAVGIVNGGFAAVPQAGANRVRLGIAVQSGAKEALRMHLGHGAAASVNQNLGRFRLGEERADLPSGLSALLADAVRPENAKGIPVISANDRFNLFHSHESLIIKYGRFLAGIAQSGTASAPGGLGRARDAP